jgi:pathogenicity locus Cdd1 protein
MTWVPPKTHRWPIRSRTTRDTGDMADLTSMPNIGPKVAAKLRRLGINAPEDLRGQDGEDLFERLCAIDGRRHDPCLLDTFLAAVDYADGGPARPWWEYSRERLARESTDAGARQPA